VQSNTLTLHGEDWLGQLDGRLVNYDTREILDPNSGNSMREYNLRPYLNDASRCNAPYEFAGDTNIDLAVDDTGDMTADAYNGMKIIFPYSYMGTQKDYCYAYDETVTPAAGAMNTDTPDPHGETATWVDDDAAHTMSQTEAAANCSFYVDYDFTSLAADNLAGNVKDQGVGDHFTKMTIHLTVMAYGADITDWGVQLGQVAGTWTVYTSDINLPMTEYQRITITIPDHLVNIHDANGAWFVRVYANGPGAGGTVSLLVDYLMCECEYEVDTALTTHAYTIDDTVVSAGSVTGGGSTSATKSPPMLSP
jgi:hypothetical protein